MHRANASLVWAVYSYADVGSFVQFAALTPRCPVRLRVDESNQRKKGLRKIKKERKRDKEKERKIEGLGEEREKGKEKRTS